MPRPLGARLGSCSLRGLLQGHYVEEVRFCDENLYMKTEIIYIKPGMLRLPLVTLAEDLMMSVNGAKLVRDKQLRCIVEQNGLECSIYLDRGKKLIEMDSLMYLMHDYLAMLYIHPYDRMIGKHNAITILDEYAKDLINLFAKKSIS